MSSLVAVVAGIAINYNKKDKESVEDVVKTPTLANTFIEIGESITIECPEGYTGVMVTSSDKTIASVKDLTITAEHPGSVVISFYASGAPIEVVNDGEGYSQDWVVMVNKKTNPIRINASALQYTGSEQQLLSVSGAVGEVRYYLTETTPSANYDDWSTEIPTGRDVGRYTIYWHCEGDEVYDEIEGMVEVDIATTLNQVNIQPTINYYTGEAFELVQELGVHGAHGNVYYSVTTPLNSSNYDREGSQTVPTGVEVGEYTVYWYCTGNTTSSYAEGYVVAEIKVGTNNVSVVGLNHVYDGESKPLVQEQGIEGLYGDVYYSVATALNASNYKSDGSLNVPTASNVGTYVIYWYCEGNDYYDATSGVAYAVISVSYSQPNVVGVELGYNGEAQALVTVDGVADAYGDIYYSTTELLSEGNYATAGSKTIPTATDIDMYTIYWYCVGSENYASSYGVVYSNITIGDNKVEISSVEQAFTGEDIELAVEDGVKGAYGDVYYSTSKLLTANNYATDGSTVVPKAKYGGVYNVFWYCAGNEYYEGVSGNVVSVITAVELDAPTNIEFTNLGVASWDEVETFDGVVASYECQLYLNNELISTKTVYDETLIDWSSIMLKARGAYTIKVRALSNRESSMSSNTEFTACDNIINTNIVYFDVNNTLYGNVNPSSAIVLPGWVIDGSTEELKGNDKVIATASTNNVEGKVVRFIRWSKSFGTFANGETITAEFEIYDNDYIVNYDANGGTGSMPSDTFTFDTQYNLSPNGFERDGYTFIGWSTTIDGEVEYEDEEVVSNLGIIENPEITLYAVWEENTPVTASAPTGLRQAGEINTTNPSLKQEEDVMAGAAPYAEFNKSWFTKSGYDITDFTHIYFQRSEPNWAGPKYYTVSGVQVYVAYPNIAFVASGAHYDNKTGWTGLDIKAPDNCGLLFSGFSNLQYIKFSQFDTSSVYNMAGMFKDCSSLTTVDWGMVSTYNVTNMEAMFQGCTSLYSLKMADMSFANVTTMRSMFEDCTALTSIDLEEWYVPSLTIVEYMFKDCTSLTSVSPNRTDYNYLKLDGVGTKLKDISYMFQNCSSLPNMYLNFDVSNVTTMLRLFRECSSLTEVTFGSNFKVGSTTTNLGMMFYKCTSLKTLSMYTWDTSAVTNMSYMFWGCIRLTELDISDFIIPTNCTVKNMLDFIGETSQHSYMRKIDLPKDMGGQTLSVVANNQFYVQSTGTQLTKSGNTYTISSSYQGESLVTTAYTMAATLPEADVFHARLKSLTGLSSIEYISSIEFMYDDDAFNIGGIERLGYINSASQTIGLYSLNESNTCLVISHPYKIYAPADSSGLFYINTAADTELGLASIEFENFDTSKVTDMSGMFTANALTTLDLSIFDTSKVTNMSSMFEGCFNLGSIDLSSFDTSKVTDMHDMFGYCNSLRSLDLSLFSFESLTAGTGISLSSYPLLPNLTCANYGFYYSENSLVKLTLPSNWGNVTGVGIGSSNALYYQGTQVTTSQIDESAAMDIISKAYAGKTLSVAAFLPAQATFHSKLEQLTGCQTENITTINFAYDTYLYSAIWQYTHCGTLDSANRISVYKDPSDNTHIVIVSDYDIIAPTSCSLLFGTYTESGIAGFPGLLELSFDNFHTGTTTSFNAMFQGAKNLTSIDVSRFDSSKVTKFSCMFLDCSNLSSIYFGTSGNSKFSFASATNVSSMFANCVKLGTLDFSGIVSGGTGALTSSPTMFYRCYVLSSITGLDRINFTNVTNAHSMFMACENLRSITLPSFDKLQQAQQMFANCKTLTLLEVDGLDTTNVTNFSRMFANCTSLETISYLSHLMTDATTIFYSTSFDVSNATNMDSMFANCPALTQLDLSTWNTSKVTTMSNMFNGCVALSTLVTGDNWDTSKVTNMNSMFASCHELDSNITLNVTSVQSLYCTFYECWDITNITLTGTMNKVTNMVLTFYDCDMLETITFPSTMDTSKVTDMTYLFGECPKLKTINNVDKITTPSVTSLYGMFDNCSSLTSLKLSFDTTLDVLLMSLMFRNCSSLTTLTIDGLFTSSVKSFRCMFEGCSNLETLTVSGNFNTNSATDLGVMFCGCEKLKALPNITWNTSNVTDMYGMFKNCKALISIDTSAFSGSAITNTNSMFQGCSSLTGTINLSGLDLSNVTDARHMFYGCSGISTITLNSVNSLGDFDAPANLQAMFYECKNLTNLTLPEIIHPSVTLAMFQSCEKLQSVSAQFYGCDNTSYMFYNCYELTAITVPSNAHFLIKNTKNVNFMFANCYKLTTIDGLTEASSTVSFTSMDSTFMNCKALTSLSFGNYNASNLTNMHQTFYGCESLTSLDLSKWNTSKVTSMYHTFTNCYELTTLKLGSNFTTASSTNNRAMFQNCYKLVGTNTTVGLEGTFDLGKTTDVYGMFYNNRALTKIPAITCNNEVAYLLADTEKMFTNCRALTNITFNCGISSGNARDMFSGCSNLETINVFEIILNNADAAGMFNGCSSLTNVPINNSSSFTNMYMMFNGCSSLTSINVSRYNVSQVTSMEYVFNNCTGLTSLDLSQWQWGGLDTVTSMSHMFANCQNLTEIKGIENFRTKNVTAFSRMFYNCVSLTELTLKGHYYEDGPWQLTSANNMNGMFQVEGASKPSQLHTIDLSATSSGWTSTFENAAGMFYGLRNLTNLTLPQFLSVVNAHAMFHGCSKLKTITYLDGLSTGNATNLSSMFAACNSLTTDAISVVEDWNTSNVTNMENMFAACAAITSLDLSHWNTSKVTDMSNMFAYTWRITTLNLDGWDTDQVTDMSTMFQAASGLKTLDIRTFDLSGITDTTKAEDIFNFIGTGGSNDIETIYAPKELGTLGTLDFASRSYLEAGIYEDGHEGHYKYLLTSVTIYQPLDNTVSTNDTYESLTWVRLPQVIVDANGGSFVGNAWDCLPWDADNDTQRITWSLCPIYLTGAITDPPPTSMLVAPDGYEFSHWSTTKNGPSDWEFYPTADTIYYAIYKTGDAIFPEYDVWQARMGEYGITTDQIISISFLKEHSSGYTKIGTVYDSGCIEIWTKSTTDGVHVEFVWDATIYAPVNSSNLFSGIMKHSNDVETYIDFTNFNTSKATTMQSMFAGIGNANDVALNNVNFDTSNVTNMASMFFNSNADFDGNPSLISNWNTAIVTNMSGMFRGAYNIKRLELANWDTSSVTNMSEMFMGCTPVYVDISGFDMSSITNATDMFGLEMVLGYHGSGARIIKLPTNFGALTDSGIDIYTENDLYSATTHQLVIEAGEATTIPSSCAGDTLVAEATFPSDWKAILSDKYSIDATTIKNITFLYEGGIWEIEYDRLGTLTTDGMIDIYYGKADTASANGIVFVWPAPIFAPVDSTELFSSPNEQLSVQSINFINFDTSKTTNMSWMFSWIYSTKILGIEDWDVSKVTDMSGMFNTSDIGSLDLSKWDTSSVTSMHEMFNGVHGDVLNISGDFIPAGSANLQLFAMGGRMRLTQLNKIVLPNNFNNVSEIVINSAYDLYSMNTQELVVTANGEATISSDYAGDTLVVGATLPGYETLRTKIKTLTGYAYNAITSIKFLHDAEGLEDAGYEKLENTLNDDGTIDVYQTGTKIAFVYPMILAPVDSTHLFDGYNNLTELVLTNFNTINVIDMSYMFRNCSSLTSIDLSKFNTSNVTNMGSMFCDISGSGSSLTSLDVSSFDTSNVTDMLQMFTGCSSLTRLDVSNFNTSKVTSMLNMFSGCSGLTSLDLTNFNTSVVTNMMQMFTGCSGLQSITFGNNFNTGAVNIMDYMFDNCSSLTGIDLSKFNTSKVTRMQDMFRGCSGLTSLDLSSFDTSKVTEMGSMFSGCSRLTELDLSNFDLSLVTNMNNMFEGCSDLTTLQLPTEEITTDKKIQSLFKGCSSLTSLDLSNFKCYVNYNTDTFKDCASLEFLDISGFIIQDVDNTGFLAFGETNQIQELRLPESYDYELPIVTGSKLYSTNYSRLVVNGTATATIPLDYQGDILTTDGTFNVSFEVYGGETEGVIEEREVTVGNPYGEMPTLSEEHIPTGYEFDGWYGKNMFDIATTSKTRGKTDYGYYVENTSNVTFNTYETLEAHMGKEVTISFYLTVSEDGDYQVYQYQNNGIGITGWKSGYGVHTFTLTANQTVRIEMTGTVAVLGTTEGYSAGEVIVYRSGYTGSYKVENIQLELGDTATTYSPYVSDEEITAETIMSTASDHSIVARWKKLPTPTVTFDANGGTVNPTSKQVTYSYAYGELPTPTRDGYEFDGWYGKNLINIDAMLNSVLVDNLDGSYTITKGTDRFGKYQEILIPAGTTLTFSADVINYTGNQTQNLLLNLILESDNDSSTVDATYLWTTTSLNSKTVTLTRNVIKMNLYLLYSDSSGAQVTFKNVQLEVGSTATSYHRYAGGVDVTEETIVSIATDHDLCAKWTPVDNDIEFEFDANVNLFANNNIAFDSTFESGSTGNASVSSGGSVSVTNTTAFNGTCSLTYNVTGATNKYIYYSTTLAAGTYNFSAFVMANKKYDNGYVSIQNGSDYSVIAEISTSQEANIWYYINTTFTLSANTTVRFAFYGIDNATHYVDDIVLTRDGTQTLVTISYTIATATITLPYLAKEGYTFLGWSKTENGSSGVFKTISGKDLFNLSVTKLYAQFELSNPATIVTPKLQAGLYNSWPRSPIEATLHTSVLDSSARYQWYCGASEDFVLDSSTLISGATGKTYTPPEVMDAGNYYFRCLVTTNVVGIKSTLAIVAISMGSPGPIPPVEVDIMQNYQYGNDEDFAQSTPRYTSASDGDITFYYYGSGETRADAKEWKNMTSTTLNVGTYYIYAVVGATNNYNEYISADDTFTVTEGTIIVKISSNGGTRAEKGMDVSFTKVYNGSALDGYIQANIAHTLRYGSTTSYTNTESRTADAIFNIATITNVGSVKYYFEVSAPNYTSVTGSITLIIEKQSQQVIWPDDTSIIYNATDQSNLIKPYILVNEEKVYCDVTFTIDGVDTPFINAGTYVATASLSDGNYKLSGITNNVTINELAVEINAEDKTIVYGDSTVDYTHIANKTIPDVDQPYTVEYKVFDGETDVTESISTLDVGTYTIRPISVTLPEGRLLSNFDFTYIDGILTITNKDLKDAIIDEIEDQVYTSEEIKPTPTVNLDSKILVVGTDFTFSYADNINVGTATITITAVEGGNYIGSTSTTFNIIKADVIIDVEDLTMLRGETKERNVTLDYVGTLTNALSVSGAGEYATITASTITDKVSTLTIVANKSVNGLEITVTYPGDNNHNESSVTFKLTIESIKVLVDAKDTSDNGVDVTVTIDGDADDEVIVGKEVEIVITTDDESKGWLSYQFAGGETIYNTVDNKILDDYKHKVTITSDMVINNQVSINVLYDTISTIAVDIEGDEGSITYADVQVTSEMNGNSVSHAYDDTTGTISIFSTADTSVSASVNNDDREQYYAIKQVEINDEKVTFGATLIALILPESQKLEDGDKIKFVSAKVYNAEQKTSGVATVTVEDPTNNWTVEINEKPYIMEDAKVNIVVSGVNTNTHSVLAVTVDGITTSVDQLGADWDANNNIWSEQGFTKELSEMQVDVRKKLTDITITVDAQNPNATVFLQHETGFKYSLTDGSLNTGAYSLYEGNWQIVIEQASGVNITLTVNGEPQDINNVFEINDSVTSVEITLA